MWPTCMGGSTTISAGTVTHGVANALPAATALAVTGTLDLAGFAQTVASVTGSGTVTDSGAAQTFTVNNAGLGYLCGLVVGFPGADQNGRRHSDLEQCCQYVHRSDDSQARGR